MQKHWPVGGAPSRGEGAPCRRRPLRSCAVLVIAAAGSLVMPRGARADMLVASAGRLPSLLHNVQLPSALVPRLDPALCRESVKGALIVGQEKLKGVLKTAEGFAFGACGGAAGITEPPSRVFMPAFDGIESAATGLGPICVEIWSGILYEMCPAIFPRLTRVALVQVQPQCSRSRPSKCACKLWAVRQLFPASCEVRSKQRAWRACTKVYEPQ